MMDRSCLSNSYSNSSERGPTYPELTLINVNPMDVRLPNADHTGIALAEFLFALAKEVRKNDNTAVQYQREHPSGTQRPASAAEEGSPLTRVEMVHQIQNDLDARTTLLVESGDSWFNGEYIHLPDGARFEIEMQWGSIGWSVPATMGYAMALEPERRVIAMIGDGSFQLTAQEVSTMIYHHLGNITIFLVNNHGYVIESAIHEGSYNYYKNWDYAALMRAWNAEDGQGLGIKVTTAGELTKAINMAREHTAGPVLIECQIAHDDYTQEMSDWGKKVSKANGRPPLPA